MLKCSSTGSVLSVATTICVAAILYRSALDAARPSIELIPPQLDFGQVSEQQVISNHVMIRNNSRDGWQLTDIETTCQCTAAGTTLPMVLNPGETHALPVVFSSGRGDGIRVQQLFLILEKKGLHPRAPAVIPLQVQCVVVPEIRVEPSFIAFGTIEPDSEQDHTTRTFRLRSVVADGKTISRISSSHPCVSASGPSVVSRDGEQFYLTLDHKQAGSIRSLSGVVTVTFAEEPAGADLRVPFNATIVPRYFVLPDVIVFSSDVSHQNSRSLTVHGHTPFRVSVIECPAGFVCRVESPLLWSCEHHITVMAGETAQSEISDRLRVRASAESGDSTEIEISVQQLTSSAKVN